MCRIVAPRACSRSLKEINLMPRRAFRNGVIGGRHFGGVIQYPWTGNHQSLPADRDVSALRALAESTINRSAGPTRRPLTDRRAGPNQLAR